MKLEANIEAVILRQSLQLQTKVSTRPGAVVGWLWEGWLARGSVLGYVVAWTYKEALDGAAEAGGCRGLAVFAAFDALGGQWESSGAHVGWWIVVGVLEVMLWYGCGCDRK